MTRFAAETFTGLHHFDLRTHQDVEAHLHDLLAPAHWTDGPR